MPSLQTRLLQLCGALNSLLPLLLNLLLWSNHCELLLSLLLLLLLQVQPPWQRVWRLPCQCPAQERQVMLLPVQGSAHSSHPQSPAIVVERSLADCSRPTFKS